MDGIMVEARENTSSFEEGNTIWGTWVNDPNSIYHAVECKRSSTSSEGPFPVRQVTYQYIQCRNYTRTSLAHTHTHTHTYTHKPHTYIHIQTHTHVHQILHIHTHTYLITRTQHTPNHTRTHTHTHNRMQLHRINHKMSPPLTSTGEPHPLPTQLPSTSNCHWRSRFGRPSNPILNLVNLYMVPLLPGSLPIFSYLPGLLWCSSDWFTSTLLLVQCW